MQLKTFGEVKLEGSKLTRPTPLLLLTYLSVEGKKPRRYLADLFYQHAKNKFDSLTQALRQLKTNLDDGLVIADRSNAQTTIPSDVNDFLNALDKQEFETAISLYKGAFLADLNLALEPELEEWVYGTREYLAARAREAFLQVAEGAHKQNNLSQAASYAERAYGLGEALGLALEPDQFGRVYRLLVSAKHPKAAEVKEEAEGYGIALTLESPVATEPKQPTVIPHNLPPPKTSFVGRDQDLIDIATQLAKPDCRLLTLHGMGGIGKSRFGVASGE